MLSLLGATICLLVLVISIKDEILFRYYVWRLNIAPTFQDAKPFLDATLNVQRQVSTPKRFVARLGHSHLRFTLWFFCFLDSGNIKSNSVIESFATELETNDALIYCWSCFVRWRLGMRLNQLLDELMAKNDAFHGVWVNTFHRDPMIARLRQYGIAWFLGFTPIPRLASANLTLYLRQSLLNLHDLRFDKNQGHCIAEREGWPALKTFSQIGIPIPTAPLPGWNEGEPDLSGFRGDESSLRMLIEPPQAYDLIRTPSDRNEHDQLDPEEQLRPRWKPSRQRK